MDLADDRGLALLSCYGVLCELADGRPELLDVVVHRTEPFGQATRLPSRQPGVRVEIDRKKVFIVVDPSFGAELEQLARYANVWAIDSDANRSAVEGIWASPWFVKQGDAGEGLEVTHFEQRRGEEVEAACARIVDVVHTHHAYFENDDDNWSEIEVFGVSLTDPLRAAFVEVGAVSFSDTGRGFIARR